MNLDDFTTQMFGPIGTKRRSEFEYWADHSRRTDRYLNAVLGWTRRIPIFGRLVFCFWYSLLASDMRHYVSIRPMEVLHPYGALGFSFLNDGMRPTIWHTWKQLIHTDDRYTGIWHPRAPRNQVDAERILAYYRTKGDTHNGF